MKIRTTFLAGLMASALALAGGSALAQDASPSASPAALATPSGGVVLNRFPLSNPNGEIVAYAEIKEDVHGVTITVTNSSDSGLEPGTHRIHIHEIGSCDASGDTPYASAGGHFNPTDASHGAPDDEASHAGDLGKLMVAGDGTISFEITTDKVTLDPNADNGLAGQHGSSLVIHAGEDDMATDPSGDSGSREACGIIYPSVEPTLNTVPPTSSSPEATPAS